MVDFSLHSSFHSALIDKLLSRDRDREGICTIRDDKYNYQLIVVVIGVLYAESNINVTLSRCSELLKMI